MVGSSKILHDLRFNAIFLKNLHLLNEYKKPKRSLFRLLLMEHQRMVTLSYRCTVVVGSIICKLTETVREVPPPRVKSDAATRFCSTNSGRRAPHEKDTTGTPQQGESTIVILEKFTILI